MVGNAMTDAGQLLRAYVAESSEEAFRELVEGHIGLVYSTALRVVGADATLARDVTQTVFMDLARKARTLPPDVVLSGWLYRHTTFTASKLVRGESRRRAREQEATAMNGHDESEAVWEQLTPLLDGAMASLSGKDRDAVVMRYFEKRDFRSVAATLKLSEDAAQKRVTRALEKLRRYFERRGVAVSGTSLGAVIAAHAVGTAPSTLAGAVAGNALAQAGAAATPFLISLLMAKIKTIAVGAAVIAAVGTPLIMQQQSIARLRAENQQLKQEQSAPNQTEVGVAAAPSGDNRELLQLRAEVARLWRAEADMAKVQAATNRTPAKAPAPISPPVPQAPVPSETWNDRGFATPMNTLETAHWAIRNANIEKFRESLHITDAARRKLHDVIAKMAANVRPEQAEEARKVLDEAANRGWDAEEGMLFPMIAQDKKHRYKSYRVLTENVTPDEQQITIELEMNSAPAQTKQFRFKQFGDAWKQVIDVQDLPAEVR